MDTQVIAIDWSGDKNQARKKIWRAKAAVPGDLEELENGLDREETIDYLVEQADHNRKLIIGLDFAFSLPAWFLAERRLESPHELWALADREAEDWLKNCQAPFWGRPGHPRPDLPDHFRQTERAVPIIAGIRPKSAFQIGGGGAVGTGSLRSMSLLQRLRDAGFSVWPFDPPGWPRVVEIYPRVLTGKVIKSNPAERESYLSRYPKLAEDKSKVAASSEDAFDATVSALAMVEHREHLSSLRRAIEPQILREGWIWSPSPAD